MISRRETSPPPPRRAPAVCCKCQSNSVPWRLRLLCCLLHVVFIARRGTFALFSSPCVIQREGVDDVTVRAVVLLFWLPFWLSQLI